MFSNQSKKIKPAAPVKIVPFEQSNFANLFGNRGMCYALVKAWYDQSLAGKSLIKEIGYGLLTDKRLIFKIIQWQKKSNRSLVKSNNMTNDDILDKEDSIDKEDFFKELFGENWQKEMTKITTPESILLDLNFSEATQSPFSSSFTNFLDHLNSLEHQHRNHYGLHVIELASPERSKGHHIGWTFKDNYYILFDPKVGEMYFNDFNQFKEFTYNYIQSKKELYEMFSAMDFYSEIDLKEIEKIRIQQEQKKEEKSSHTPLTSPLVANSSEVKLVNNANTANVGDQATVQNNPNETEQHSEEKSIERPLLKSPHEYTLDADPLDEADTVAKSARIAKAIGTVGIWNKNLDSTTKEPAPVTHNTLIPKH